MEDCEGVSWQGAKSFFKTLASKLGSGPRSAALRPKVPTDSDMAKRSEKDPLIHLEAQLIDLEKAE